MKYLLLLTAFLAVMASSSAQENPDCGWYGTKTVAERNAMFPFNKAKKVVLVSYPDRMDSISSFNQDQTFVESHKIIDTINLSVERLGGNTYFILEKTVLNQVSINQLSNILINYTRKVKERYDETMSMYVGNLCKYQPRASILFYDERDQIICVYEICFFCGQSVMAPDKDNINDVNELLACDAARIREINAIFIKNGITYGVEMH